jgi:citrate lyase subunit beta/citryl-CoA lyase
MKRPPPAWRSMLYVPAHVDRFVAAAHTRGADCILLDLEDSVPQDRKAEARAKAVVAASRLKALGCDVAVRINAPLRNAFDDIDAVVGHGVRALFLPKARSAEHVRMMDEAVSQAEAALGIEDRPTRLVPIVETCDGYFAMQEIAKACERVMALMLGAEDLALEAGFEPDEATLRLPKQQVVFAAAAAGVVPFGLLGSVTSFDENRDAWREMARRSRRFGFVGATCIHPAQVTIVNEAFTPTDEEVQFAERIVRASDDAQREGRGAFAVDGRMIDRPVVERARRLLARRIAIDFPAVSK